MARPIIPVAARRTHIGALVEVQSKGGNWIPLSLLGGPSMETLVTNVLKGRVLPAGVFHWTADDDGTPTVDSPFTAPTPTDTVEPTDPTPTDEQDDNVPDTEPTPDNDGSQRPPTIEDLVRQIAGKMDSDVAAKLVEMMDEKLAEFTPVTNGNDATLTPVLTNVVIHRPDLAPLPVDGLFHQSMPTLLRLVAAGAHVYLPGSPGTGKSHAAAQVAEMLGYMFGSKSFGPTTPESHLWGGMTANGEFFEPMLLKLIRHAMANPDSGAVFCLDEMDNAHPGILATLNSLLANGWVTAPNGDHLTIGKNMVFVACANTYGTGPTAEFSGRNKLDAATLDRFRMLPWEIDLGVEEVLVRQRIADTQTADAWLDVWRTARRNVADHGLKIFVTPRGAVNGATDVAAGFTLEEAFAFSLGNKLPKDQLAKVNPF